MKKSLLGLIVCSLILLIVVRFPVKSEHVRSLMELFYRFIIVVIAIGVTWRFNRYVAAFLGLALFSQFYPIFCNESVGAFYNVFFGVVLYVVIVANGNKEWCVQLMNMLCIVALLHSIFVLLQLLGIYTIWENNGAIIGIMENQNSASAFFALCFPAFLRKKWKYFIPIVIFGLFATKSSGGMIAVLLGLCFYACVVLKDKRYLYPVGLGIILTGALFVIFFDQYQSCNIRIEIWGRALELYQQTWLFGCGLGRWKVELTPLIFAGEFPHYSTKLHSSIFQSIVEMGIGFVVILIGYLVNIGRRSWRNLVPLVLPLTALIIILTNGSVNFLIRIAPNAALVIVWLAILEIQLRKYART